MELLFANSKKRINWKKGSVTVLVYIIAMWLIVMIAVLFMEYYNMFSHVGKTQIFADLLADGSAFLGNNGWGLDEDEAEEAKGKLVNYNDESFDGVTANMGFSHTTKSGSAYISKSSTDGNNTVDIKTHLKASMLSENKTFKADKNASTQITYSGGVRIVLEAWRHTYQFWHSENGQTHYVWGGGHGSDTEWEQYADCSGFVSGVFRKCGYNIPNWACTWNMEKMGELVGEGPGAYEKARPGDIILIWWSGASGPSDHVAIYAGKHNGTHYMVHCSGGPDNTYGETEGKGAGGGALLAPAAYAPRIMVRRIVDADANAYETPEVTIPGLSVSETTAYFTLSACGFSDAAAAAAIGNFVCEGGMCPITRNSRVGGESDPINVDYAERLKRREISRDAFVYNTDGVGDGGYGIAQWTTTDWTNPYQDRKAKLWNFTGGYGNVCELSLQLSFVNHEIKYGGQWAGPAVGAPAQYGSVSLEQFLSSTDPQEAAKAFQARYERTWDNTVDRRVAAAQRIYDGIKAYYG